MARNWSACRLAPPIRAPSTPGRLKQRGGVLRLDAAAVLDDKRLSRFLVEHLTEAAPNDGVRLLSLLGGGVVSGMPIAQTGSYAMVRRVKVSADRPANPWMSCRSSTASVWSASRWSRVSPTAEDHVEAGGQGNPYLLVDERIGFAQLVPALAVSEDNVLAAEIEEHRRADLAGERAFLFGIEVLRPSATRLPLRISPTRAR